MKRLPKIVLIVFFLALLATPFVIKRYYQPGKAEVDTTAAMNRY